MSVPAPPTGTAPPTPPARNDPASFAARGDAFLGWFPAAWAYLTELSAWIFSRASDVNAQAQAVNQVVNVTAWSSGVTYAAGACVWDPTTALTYRRKTTGAGTTRPELDPTAWALLTGQGDVRLDASGNLGVGTTSPSYRLDVSATGSTVSSAFRSDQSEMYIMLKDSGTTLGHVRLGSASGAMLFNAGNAERARITSNGDFLVGTTTTGFTNSRSFTFQGLGDGKAYVNHSTANGNGDGYIGFGFGGTQIGFITQSGTTAVAYNTSSDYRLKTITGPITTSGAYIDRLNPVEGTWKADGSTFVGLIAHEVQEVSRTNVATGVKDGEQMQGMDYSSAEIIANMLAELKSLRARVAALESSTNQ